MDLQPDGTRCRTTGFIGQNTEITGVQRTAAGIAAARAEMSGQERCPATPRAPGLVLVPSVEAESFIRMVPMPIPRLEIDPGLAVTGLPAYLETGGTTTHSVGPAPTALGPITVTATGAYFVDWGDGTPEAGPFPFEGVAYPEGRITHVYRDRGTYTVTVREAWSADWSLAGASGTVGGLQTEATLELEVEEIQPVRLR